MASAMVRRYYQHEMCTRFVDLLQSRIAVSLDEEHPDLPGLCTAIALIVAVDEHMEFVSRQLVGVARATVGQLRGGRLPTDSPTITREFASCLPGHLLFLVPADQH